MRWWHSVGKEAAFEATLSSKAHLELASPALELLVLHFEEGVGY